MRKRFLIPAVVACSTAGLTTGTRAQSVADTVRAGNLGSGYAQMLNLTTTPDFSAARYKVRGSEPSATIDITRLPYQAKLASLTPNADLWWRVAMAYFRVDSDLVFPVLGLRKSVSA